MIKQVGNFTFNSTSIDGVYVIERKKYGDNRGYFSEIYKKEDFCKAGLNYNFVQNNESVSTRGVCRGLHFQKIHSQAKLVRCTYGKVFDVCVDLRKDSPTFGKWESVILSSETGNLFMIPRGFAHGFMVLSDYAVFSYMCDDYYYPEEEDGIIWNDEVLGINWPVIDDVIISNKDKNNKKFRDLKI